MRLYLDLGVTELAWPVWTAQARPPFVLRSEKRRMRMSIEVWPCSIGHKRGKADPPARKRGPISLTRPSRPGVRGSDDVWCFECEFVQSSASCWP